MINGILLFVIQTEVVREAEVDYLGLPSNGMEVKTFDAAIDVLRATIALLDRLSTHR